MKKTQHFSVAAKIALVLLMCVGVATVVLAGPPPPPPNQVPVDGGAAILGAAGVAYAVKKFRDMKKSK